MQTLLKFLPAVGLAASLPFSALAAPVGIDGTIGAEWAGVPSVAVIHDANAPTSNFGTPSNTTAGPGYTVQVRGDGSYVYVALRVTDNQNLSIGNFANLYFDTDPQAANGSDVGFEVTNNRYFIPGVGGYYDASPYLTYDASNAGIIELAIADAFFTSGPMAGIAYPGGYPAATDQVVLRLSQSFGYSVAGGASYGPTRLGSASVLPAAAVVPEPGSLALCAAALGSLGWASRRKRATKV